jgi:hypothetical protein
MDNERDFTMEEQIEFIKLAIAEKEEYAGTLKTDSLEFETAQKELGLLKSVRVSLLQLDLLDKMQAEGIEPIL